MSFGEEQIILESEYVKLEPFEERHKSLLYNCAIENQEIFHHMFFGPFNNQKHFSEYIDSKRNQKDSLAFAVFLKSQNRYVGSASVLNIREGHRVSEIGSVWYRTSAQGTEVNSAVVNLLLEYLFEKRSFRRIEWKCDKTNEASRNAALGMGFIFEGTFRNHMLIKGRNRDTAWFSVIEEDWPQLKKTLKARIELKSSMSPNS